MAQAEDIFHLWAPGDSTTQTLGFSSSAHLISVAQFRLLHCHLHKNDALRCGCFERRLHFLDWCRWLASWPGAAARKRLECQRKPIAIFVECENSTRSQPPWKTGINSMSLWEIPRRGTRGARNEPALTYIVHYIIYSMRRVADTLGVKCVTGVKKKTKTEGQTTHTENGERARPLALGWYGA
jgi:hypothetical protein